MSHTFIIIDNPTAYTPLRKKDNHTFNNQEKARIEFERQIEEQIPTPFSGPLHVDIQFHIPMPRINAARRKEMEGAYDYTSVKLTTLLDFLKTLKENGFYSNECMVASLSVRKIFSEEPKVEFKITELR